MVFRWVTCESRDRLQMGHIMSYGMGHKRVADRLLVSHMSHGINHRWATYMSQDGLQMGHI